MFKKLVAIEPVNLIPSAEEALHRYAREVVLFGDVPKDDAEIIRRIGDADAVLLSYTSRIGQAVIDACPAIRYIGMCCSLYSEASANVDIAYARQKNIRVLGIRDYGDRGVVEYVLHELIALLHGYGMPSLRDEPIEITGLRVGVVGLGVSGRMIADALSFMGAEISYYSRSRKPEAEQAGMTYKPLDRLLSESEVVFTCLNKNVLLLGTHEFEQLGAGKALFNTSIGPGFDSKALENWLNLPNTHFCQSRGRWKMCIRDRRRSACIPSPARKDHTSAIPRRIRRPRRGTPSTSPRPSPACSPRPDFPPPAGCSARRAPRSASCPRERRAHPSPAPCLRRFPQSALPSACRLSPPAPCQIHIPANIRPAARGRASAPGR